jgi:hypothetical protein
MKFRPAFKYIVIGVIFIIIAVVLQIKLSSSNQQKPQDSATPTMLHQPKHTQQPYEKTPL